MLTLPSRLPIMLPERVVCSSEVDVLPFWLPAVMPMPPKPLAPPPPNRPDFFLLWSNDSLCCSVAASTVMLRFAASNTSPVAPICTPVALMSRPEAICTP